MNSFEDLSSVMANMLADFASNNLPVQEIAAMNKDICNNMKIFLSQDYIQDNRTRTIIKKYTKSCFRSYKRTLEYFQFKTDLLIFQLSQYPIRDLNSAMKVIHVVHWGLVRKLSKLCNSLFFSIKECSLKMDIIRSLKEIKTFHCRLVSLLQRFHHVQFEVRKNLLNRI